MKRIVGILAIILLISTVFMTLVGCNNNKNKPDDDTDNKDDNNVGEDVEGDGNNEDEVVYQDYTVKVADGLGIPVSDVIVTFKNDAGEEKMRVTDKDGMASYKNAPAGNYTVLIKQGYSDVEIIQSEYRLSKDITSVNVTVRNPKIISEIYGAVPDNTLAYGVGVGEYNPVCSLDERTFFVFNARAAGVYRISIETDDANATVGYYGLPMFVQQEHCGEGEYDGRSFDIVIQDPATPYVLGISLTEQLPVSLNIERTGDAPFDPNYAEWITVQATADIEKLDFEGKTLVNLEIEGDKIDITLGDDGHYYTADGKKVYIRITTISPYGYTNENFEYVHVLGGSLAFLAGYVDQNVGGNIGGYVYDDNGNFLAKYSYNEMIKTYMDNADAKYGVVALTEELVECLMLHGESNGWFDPDSPTYLFRNVDINPENAWLFLCMVEFG